MKNQRLAWGPRVQEPGVARLCVAAMFCQHGQERVNWAMEKTWLKFDGSWHEPVFVSRKK